MNIDITESYKDFEKFEKWRDNFDWFYSNYEELKRDYDKQYVAVKDKRHIDHDYNLERLTEVEFIQLCQINCHRICIKTINFI